MRPAVLVLAGVLLLGANGCGSEKQANVEPLADATHVSGTLTAIDDQRPVDGGVTLTLRTSAGRDEPVFVASMFTGQPPTTVVLVLQQKVNELKIGDRLTATGARDDDGTFVVERIDILAP